MFQVSDSPVSTTNATRATWMGLLARAPLPLLEQVLEPHARTSPVWLRRPETGLMMIEGRVGGTGDRFNLGEITVTRCALRLSNTTQPAPVGISYVLGRSHRHAFLAAIADALLLSAATNVELEQTLLAPLRQVLALQKSERQQRADSSKVEFFTVARESGRANDPEEQP